MRRNFSVEEKMSAIGLVFQGESARSVSRRLHLGHHILYEWIESYKLRGIEGLKPKGKRQRRLSYEEKCRIIREYQESELTLCQLSAKYDIASSVLANWVRLAERKGFETLMSKKRGPKTGMVRMKRLSKDECEKENERLRKENERLRLENLGESPAKKSESLSRGKRSPKQSDWAQAIEELRRNEHADLGLLLELKKMARSTFYYHLKNSKKEDKYREDKDMIYTIFHRHKGRYGYRRITLELRNRNRLINHKTVKKLMDELGLKSEVRKVKYRSYKGAVGKTAPNIIDRDFVADRPYQKLATDVTQMTVGGCKIYLSPILDMCDGEILSYTITEAPNLEMVMSMLNQMYERIELPKGAVLHSDQGWHYQHAAYQNSLKKHNIIQSMSRKGNCLDNAMMENFFGLMKSELLYPGKYTSAEVFKKDLIEYIEYYNNERIKLRLNGMSPVQYRTQFQMSNNV